VALERFQGSGLTEAALRGADFVGFQHENDLDERVELVGAAATRAGRTLVYAYERELDHCGHVDGCHSVAWRRQLRRIDRMCERLRAALPDDVRLVITGDHGMVDVPKKHQIIAEDERILMAGVSALAGEARFRQLCRSGPACASRRPLAGPARGDGVGPTRDEAIGRSAAWVRSTSIYGSAVKPRAGR
jgi:predicted AlkP superfamily pyrophosphatase or phosphodiesterase